MPAATATASRDDLRRARISIDFFTAATVSFGAGVAATPWVVGQDSGYFYQPLVMALVHTFALGWITAVIMGVMYRYVPALTHAALPYPRLLVPQFVLYLIGASGMISHFALASWSGVWSAALVVIASIGLFAANIVPLLWRSVGRGVAETGMFIALCFLIAAASLGFLLALDKGLGFLGGSTIPNLASHAHLAALGWVTLSICSVSYRMLPALVLPRIVRPPRAAWMLYALAASTAGLAVTLLTDLPGLALWSVAIAAALAAYAVTIGRMVWSHRKPLDWSVRHAIIGMVWLTVAIALGLALSLSGAQAETGARIAAGYGVAAILGWMGNFVIGISGYLFPGFVIRVRTLRGWKPVDSTLAHGPLVQTSTFSAFNLGLAMVVAAMLSGNGTLRSIGAFAIAVGGLTYTAAALRTLSFAYRRADSALPLIGEQQGSVG